MNLYKTATIMLVDDDPGDQKLIKMSLENQHITNMLIVVSSAEEALEYLEKTKTDESVIQPDLILLDLNMPGLGGREFLRLVKADPGLEIIPIVVLTTSDADKDILMSFKLQAAGYVKKPVALVDFQEVIQTLSDYWFTICKRIPHDSNRQQDNKCFTC
jgi:CheY-like chemotaxis protein